MDKKFAISVALTSGVIVMTVALFVVVVIAMNVTPFDYSTSEPISTAPQQQEVVHPGEKIFKANCATCHRISVKVIGPPLGGVLERRDSLWVIRMIRNSSQLIASGDPTANELFLEFNRIQMTSFTSFSDEDLRNLLEYIALESKRAKGPMPAPRVEV